MLGKGFGGNAVDDVSNLELGFAEEGGVGGGDQGARYLKQLFLGGQRYGGSEFLSLGFLFGRKDLFHRSFSDTGGAFLAETSFSRLVYKDSTNLRDAYTPFLSCPDFLPVLRPFTVE
jgi:hypothetical protein